MTDRAAPSPHLSSWAFVLYTFRMPESRVIVKAPELERNLLIWLSVPVAAAPGPVRDLWTRRGEEYDQTRIEQARREFAQYLAAKILYSHELTRNAVPMDAVDVENRAIEAQG